MLERDCTTGPRGTTAPWNVRAAAFILEEETIPGGDHMNRSQTLQHEESLKFSHRLDERRSSLRVRLEQPVYLRPADSRYEEEVLSTVNFSRGGIYFRTERQHYYMGMHVEVAFPYRTGDSLIRTILGKVTRLERLKGNDWGVAIKFLLG